MHGATERMSWQKFQMTRMCNLDLRSFDLKMTCSTLSPRGWIGAKYEVNWSDRHGAPERTSQTLQMTCVWHWQLTFQHRNSRPYMCHIVISWIYLCYIWSKLVIYAHSHGVGTKQFKWIVCCITQLNITILKIVYFGYSSVSDHDILCARSNENQQNIRY